MNLFAAQVNEEGEHRFGEALGATKWGGTVYDLPPGTKACAYHWHFGEEEWLLVVSGTPTLRTPDGESVLRPWDVAVFVRGEAGAHEVRNDTDQPVRVVMLSTVSDPEVCVFPDSGKVSALAGWSRNDMDTVRLINRPEANLEDGDGEPS
jgi:uncharacterized cupin superfamily protein